MNLNDGIGTASWLEIICTVIGLLALCTSVYGVFDAIIDLINVRQDRDYIGDGPVTVLAISCLRRELILATIQLIVVGVGAVAALTPTPTLPTVSALGQMVACGSIFIVIALAISSSLDRYDRHLVEQKLWKYREEIALHRPRRPPSMPPDKTLH